MRQAFQRAKLSRGLLPFVTDLLLAHVPYPAPDAKLLGVACADRIRIPAEKAGFRAGALESASALPETFLILYPRVLLSAAAWRALRGTEPEPETALVLPADPSLCLLRTRSAPALQAARSARSAEELLQALQGRVKVKPLALDAKGYFVLSGPGDWKAAERWLLRGLVKDSEGFMSRHLERKISLAATRLLAPTAVSPNAMTLLSAVLGVAGSAFFLSPRTALHGWGAALFWLHSVLDGCDGEIARLKFQESRWGGLLDFWSDNVVHVCVFAAIALGWSRREPSALPAFLGSAAALGTALSAAAVWWTTMRGRSDSGPVFTSVSARAAETRAGRIADFLARRDFIYLVLLLAFFGKIHWFLWMGAAGSPLYFLALLCFSRPCAQKGRNDGR